MLILVAGATSRAGEVPAPATRSSAFHAAPRVRVLHPGEHRLQRQLQTGLPLLAVGFDLHRGVVACARRRQPTTVGALLHGARRLAVLEGLNDPENLGAIARSARALSDGYYTPAQVDSLLRHVFGTDTQLIDDGTYLVAERDGQVVGYAYGREEERDWNLLLDRCGGFHDLWVDEPARGVWNPAPYLGPR